VPSTGTRKRLADLGAVASGLAHEIRNPLNSLYINSQILAEILAGLDDGATERKEELLSLARLRDRFPKKITLIGVQPAVLDDLGGSLSPVVRGRIDEAVAGAVAELAAWGVPAHPRSQASTEALNPGALALHAYEGERPSASEACRIGDARFLNPIPAKAA